MNRRSIQIVAALSLSTLTSLAQPVGRQPTNADLTQAIQKALPEGATEVAQPLPIELGPLGRVQVVLYRRNQADTLFRGLVLIPAPNAPRAVPLPTEVDSAGNYEEITTAILGADIAGAQRALVILYYAHQFGQTTSNAFGRVYLYESGAFRIDEVRTHLLDGVRTAAVARQRLAPNP